jgi:hypothetical protein
MDTVQGILIFITRLARLCLRPLHHRYVAWSKPNTTSLLLGTLTDLGRREVRTGRRKCVPSKASDHPPTTGETTCLYQRGSDAPGASGKHGSDLETGVVHRSGRRRGSRWHRQGFKLLWKYKSRAASLTPRISQETVANICGNGKGQPTVGSRADQRRIAQGFSIRVCKRTIQKYMRQVRITRPRGQTWSTFLQTHAQQIWACDASSGYRLAFPLALRFLHHRTALPEGDPRGRPHISTISHRRVDGTCLFEKPPPREWDRSISSLITMASLG